MLSFTFEAILNIGIEKQLFVFVKFIKIITRNGNAKKQENSIVPYLYEYENLKKHKMKYTLTLIAIFFTLIAFSQEKKTHKIDLELKNCLAKEENKSTAAMSQCLYDALDNWDLELNATYKILQTKLNSNAKEKLKDSQRQWIKFRDKEVEFINETYGKADGTMWRVIKIDKILEITRNRTEELQLLLVDLNKM